MKFKFNWRDLFHRKSKDVRIRFDDIGNNNNINVHVKKHNTSSKIHETVKNMKTLLDTIPADIDELENKIEIEKKRIDNIINNHNLDDKDPKNL